ncbi:MAG: hypothetical protein QM778_23340 [Myxococcales bacterium]
MQSGGRAQGQAWDQGPWAPPLRPAALYSGELRDQDGNLLPNVVVTSRALAVLAAPADIAGYNRTTAVITSSEGRFDLSLDNGYYDVIAEPPPGTGYARIYSANREFRAAVATAPGAPPPPKQPDLPTIRLSPPVVLQGSLTSASGKLSELEGYTVRAFGLVEDKRTTPSKSRPVLLGTAETDADGNYVLLLPPHLDQALQ